MRNIAIITMGLLWLNVSGQKTFELTENQGNADKIKFDFEFADEIKVRQWEKNEIYVKATVNINEGENNDNFKLESKTFGSSLIIESEIEDLNSIGERRTIIDDETGKTIRIDCHVEMDLYFEVFVPKDSDIAVETISGNIEAKGEFGDVELQSISGDVDLELPKDAKADLDLSTLSGGMYTDFDIANEKPQDFKFVILQNFSEELNGGGKTVELASISGDIYLRKK